MRHLQNLPNEKFEIQFKIKAREERKITLEILHFFREAERRMLYAKRGYSSLIGYAVEVLKYSETSAKRRVSAMRLLFAVPEIEEKILNGDLNLSVLALVTDVLKRLRQLRGKKSSAGEIREVLKQCEGLSIRNAERRLADLFPEAFAQKKERIRASSDGSYSVHMNIDGETHEMIEEIRDLIGDSVPLSTLVKIMAVGTLKSLRKKRGADYETDRGADRSGDREADRGVDRGVDRGADRAAKDRHEPAVAKSGDASEQARHQFKKNGRRRANSNFDSAEDLGGRQAKSDPHAPNPRANSAEGSASADFKKSGLESREEKRIRAFKSDSNSVSEDRETSSLNLQHEERKKAFHSADESAIPGAKKTACSNQELHLPASVDATDEFNQLAWQFESHEPMEKVRRRTFSESNEGNDWSQTLKNILDSMNHDSSASFDNETSQFNQTRVSARREDLDVKSAQLGDRTQHANPAQSTNPTQHTSPNPNPTPNPRPGSAPEARKTKRKYISVQTRRSTFARAEGRCESVDPVSGMRCAEKRHLQKEHHIPVALGGTDEPENILWLCATHNRLRALEVFGRETMECYVPSLR